MRYKLWIIGLFAVIFINLPVTVAAADITNELTELTELAELAEPTGLAELAELTEPTGLTGLTLLDAILVLDASGSMNFADPDRLSSEAMMMFIDMLSVSGDRVGIVSYTDQIVASRELTLITGQGDKEGLKDFIGALQVGGFTDITLGLMEAIRLLDEGRGDEWPGDERLENESHGDFSGNQPVIILFTDGNNYLSPWNPRTQEDLDRDTEYIILTAQARGYPIYTIGLNYDGTLNYPYIQRFAYETGGLSFETFQARDLPDILSAIFASQMEIVITEAGTIDADGDWTYVQVDIPDDMIVEANITFLSGHPIEVELYDPLDRPIPFDGHWAIFTQANHYALLKVINPMPGEWTIRVQGVPGDQIRINLLFTDKHIRTPGPAVIEEPGPDLDPDLDLESEPEVSPEAFSEPELESELESVPEPRFLLHYIIIASVIIIAAAAVFIIVRKKQGRVFTGRLVIEITDNYSGEKSPPQYRNLIEYGRKTDLHTLLRGQGSPVLSGVSLIPSPSAPSHLPQLIIKCAKQGLKFKKDFMEQDASKGLVMSMRTELRIEIEAENKSVVLRYME